MDKVDETSMVGVDGDAGTLMAVLGRPDSISGDCSYASRLTEVPARNPTFCIVLLAFNDLPHARRAVESALAQTDQDFELVIVDNGSTDATHRFAKRYIKDSRVRIMRLARNQRSDAAQIVAEKTRSKYVSFLFADDYYHPNRLATAREAFEQSPDASYVFFNSRFVDEAGENLKQIPATQFGGDISSMDRFGHLYQFLLYGNTLHPCGMIVRADAYRALKGFPNYMHRLGDLTFFTRLLGAYEGVFHPSRMQSITVWNSGRNESFLNGARSDQITFERAIMLECWLDPGILDNLGKIFTKRQVANVEFKTRGERLWFLAHHVLSIDLTEYKLFGFRLLYQAALDATEEFETSLMRITGSTVSEYITTLVARVNSGATPSVQNALVRSRSKIRLLPSKIKLEFGKLLCTIGLYDKGSIIYNDAIRRQASELRQGG